MRQVLYKNIHPIDIGWIVLGITLIWMIRKKVLWLAASTKLRSENKNANFVFLCFHLSPRLTMNLCKSGQPSSK